MTVWLVPQSPNFKKSARSLQGALHTHSGMDALVRVPCPPQWALSGHKMTGRKTDMRCEPLYLDTCNLFEHKMTHWCGLKGYLDFGGLDASEVDHLWSRVDLIYQL